MSQQNPVLDLTFTASVDLSGDVSSTTSKRFRALKTDGTNEGKVTSITGVTDDVIGIQQNLPTSGELVDAAVIGTSKIRAGGVFSANAKLKIDAGGKFVAGGGGGDINWAIALEPAAADGDIVEALLLQTPRVT